MIIVSLLQWSALLSTEGTESGILYYNSDLVAMFNEMPTALAYSYGIIAILRYPCKWENL